MPPPLPPPFSGKSIKEQFLLFRKERKAIGCPSYLWNFAYISVQVISLFDLKIIKKYMFDLFCTFVERNGKSLSNFLIVVWYLPTHSMIKLCQIYYGIKMWTNLYILFLKWQSCSFFYCFSFVPYSLSSSRYTVSH